MSTKVVSMITACAASLLAAGVASAQEGGLKLPEGFTATVAHEGLGAGRHLAINANGDLFLASRNGLVALRDTNGDGKVDETAPFGDVKGTGVQVFGDWLYASDNVGVYRYPLKTGELAPSGAKQVVVDGFPM